MQTWENAFAMKSYAERMARVQRCVLLRLRSAYRTVSTEALPVVAGIIPIDMLAEGTIRTWKKRRSIEDREKTLCLW